MGPEKVDLGEVAGVLYDAVGDVHLAKVPEVVAAEQESSAGVDPFQVEVAAREEVLVGPLHAVEPKTRSHYFLVHRGQVGKNRGNAQ